MQISNKIKNKIFPRSLLARMLLIIIVPTIAAQCISTYMFYNKHWDHVKKYMIYTLAGEISFISDVYKKVSKSKIEKLNAYTFLQYKFYPNKQFVFSNQKLSRELKILRSNLQYSLPNNNIDIRHNKHNDEIEVDVEIDSGVLSFNISKKRIFASSTYIFIIWMVISTLILLTLAIVFAKNQIRSITRLSTTAEQLSKGKAVHQFTPQGAIEVRTAGYAFLKMKETIEQQVKEKTKMLAGVSHDLKTILTRFKLQLELMKEDRNTHEMKRDIAQMEKTIEDYLSFAKGEDLSSTKLINISKLLKDLVNNSRVDHVKIEFESKDKIYAHVTENPFKRAIVNLIDNAKRFASHILVKLYEEDENIIIEIHDNGPGIAKAERGKVLEPFYRIDSARNQDSGGVGLGMSISNDIITRLHGTLELARSQMGGLLVIVKLPK